MAAHAYLIAFQQPMPATRRGQDGVRAIGVTFNLDPAGS